MNVDSAGSAQPILTIIDMSGIQSYVFGSNRLRENVGASALVEQATRLWPWSIVADLVSRHNVAATRDRARAGLFLETHNLQAEVAYVGGGNAVLLFDSITTARQFAQVYTTRLLEKIPGLHATLVHVPFVWDDPAERQSLRQVWDQAWRALARKKANRTYSTPLLGLGVTAACEATGLPATDYDPYYLKPELPETDQRYRALSAEILAKLEPGCQQWARRRLKTLVPAFGDMHEFFYNPDDDAIPTEDDLGSYLAVVHADGNDMGKRFEAMVAQSITDRAALSALSDLSALVERAGSAALAKLGEHLVARFDEEKLRLARHIPIGQDSRGEGYILPFRPLVYGGDDVTFVCDGRLGLGLAVLYLQQFEEAMKRELDDQPEIRDALPPELQRCYACAGIAVVKTHYPHARAYALAEDLCANAKGHVRARRKQTDETGFSALDWHYAASALYGSTAQIRAREYQVAAGQLEMRPLRLSPPDASAGRQVAAADYWRNWPAFRKVLHTLQHDPQWKNRRNKVIALRDALRTGPEEVQRFRRRYRIGTLPTYPSKPTHLSETGWTDVAEGRRSGYFDAVEVLEFYLPIEIAVPTIPPRDLEGATTP